MGSKLGRKIFGKFAEINLQTGTKQNEVDLSPLHFANVQILIQNKYAYLYPDTKQVFVFILRYNTNLYLKIQMAKSMCRQNGTEQSIILLCFEAQCAWHIHFSHCTGDYSQLWIKSYGQTDKKKCPCNILSP